MTSTKPIRSILGNPAQGGAEKRLTDAMDGRGGDLAAAFRRSVPFLMRQSVELAPMPSRMGSASEIVDALDGPVFTVSLVTDPGGSRALLAFDRRAVTFLLEGSLGGTPTDEDEHGPGALTGPQRAIMARVAGTILKGLADVFAPLGIRLQPLPSGPGTHDEAELVALEIAIGPASRRVVIAIGRQALDNASIHEVADKAADPEDSRVPAILEQVELDVSVELGRVRRSIAEIEAFKIGDVIRLGAAVNGAVILRVGDQAILRGRPTAAGTQLAVTILERTPESGSVF
jgi:flagellar motor switch protein FliM